MVHLCRKVVVSQIREIELACRALQQLRRQLADEAPTGTATPELLQASIDEASDPVLVVDQTARIVMVNGPVARLLATSTRALKTLTIWDITHSSYQADFDVLWREFLRAGRQLGRYGLRHANGSVVEVAYCAEARTLGDWAVIFLRPLR
jgi:PAS domain-containing protein